MRPRCLIPLFLFASTLQFNSAGGQSPTLSLTWEPREDLNILLPASVRVYEANGYLPDSARVRAMYATIDLRDDNLTLRAVGSNARRETTRDAYARHDAILAINGGYFSAARSESLLVSDGNVVAPGPARFTRGAFGLVNGRPEIVWPYVADSILFHVDDPLDRKKAPATVLQKTSTPWHPTQAVGGGPVLVKAGKIRDTSHEEGFGGSHLVRHPRTAIGYVDEHTLVVMVVDGRQHASAGVTITELARLMRSVGCHEAVNLDGGGSSAMVAADEVVNVPVDIPNGNRHSLRRNASALVVTEDVPSEAKEIVVIDTDSRQYIERGIWKYTNHVNYYGDTPSRAALANPLNRAVYRFADIRRDSFQLAAWWTVDAHNTPSAMFVLHHGRSIDTLRVDQTDHTYNGRWRVFGNYLLTTGDYLEVIGTGDGQLVTDAVRLVSIGHLVEQPMRGDLRVAVISDLNAGLGSATYEWQVDSIIQRIPRGWRPDLVLCGGDMVAGMGIRDTATISKMWKGFDEHIAGPLRESDVPFAFTIGNHDGLRSYPLEREAIRRYWSDPAHQTGLTFVDKSQFPHYYSFTAGDCFFVSWDASSSKITKENLDWLAEQFEGVEARNARFRFVVGHLPLYSVAQERDSRGNVLEDGDALRKLLEKYKVDVYVSGHQHAYYPGKRGDLQLLNCGAAGSGPRRWLATDKAPVNTITIMDLFYERDTIVYTTYDIRNRDSKSMTVFDIHELPSSISGVNGFVLRNDIVVKNAAHGVFHSLGDRVAESRGTVEARIHDGRISISGTFVPDGKLTNAGAVTFHRGKNTEDATPLFTLKAKAKNKHTGTFSGAFEVSEEMAELLSAGGYYVLVRTEQHPDGALRAQLYPYHNTPPQQPAITSHASRHTYGIRDIKGLYRVSWAGGRDRDGDYVSFTYQIASDSPFQNVMLQETTGRTSSFKKTEAALYALLGDSREGEVRRLYHRVLASDGLHVSAGAAMPLRLMKSNEPLTDFVEVDPPGYRFAGKIADAGGQGSGALWDKEGKLWLADYGGALHVKLPDGTGAAFSPLRTITVNGQSYTLRPVNGIGLDLDGNILVGSNRFLFKINAATGEGIAAWEAPAGERAITSPRVNDKGEIYAMSLFADDPNYVLRQSTNKPGTFELVRTIRLPGRILTRTFDMTPDGRTLYFPDPGSALIQTFTSKDGLTYRRGEDITSTAAGSNAIAVTGSRIFAAVRPSGISGASLHMRDNRGNVMWTLPLPELAGAEARGIAVSDDLKTVIVCAWDKGGGFYELRVTNLE